MVVITVMIGTYCGGFQSVPLSLLDRCGGCQDHRWGGVGWRLGKNEQWVDGGSGVCLSPTLHLPLGQLCFYFLNIVVLPTTSWGEGETV